jgi:hypothetical protein
MNAGHFDEWRDTFGKYVGAPQRSDLLKKASVEADLRTWTNELTTVVVKSCEAMQWVASSRWSPTRRLPQAGKEYLGLDVTAFPGGQEPRWPMPVAVFELENSPSDDRVAYSLWKVLCIRATLRVVFAYRTDWDRSRKLVTSLASDVIGSLSLEEQSEISGQTIVVVGNRGEGETFPWGYFKFWRLDANLGQFEKA